jgi:formylglycine-generating enzyme required for sulfatase activity
MFKECATCPEMIVVPSGSFTMGSSESERAPVLAAIANIKRKLDRDYVSVLAAEGPQHTVIIARPFAAGRFAVTYEEWDACLNDGGCNGYRPQIRAGAVVDSR